MRTVPVFWDENLEPDISFYKIYAGSKPGGPYNLPGSPKNAGNVIQSTFDVPDGVSAYFRFTAVNTTSQESQFSVPEVADIIAPNIMFIHRR